MCCMPSTKATALESESTEILWSVYPWIWSGHVLKVKMKQYRTCGVTIPDMV